jgi:hypothetical protein
MGQKEDTQDKREDQPQPLTDRLDAARKADVLRKWDKTRRDQ